MSLGRTFRTVRHLTAEQWLFRFICRGRWAVARRMPRIFRAFVEHTMRALPQPHFDMPALIEAARYVQMLQIRVHGDHLAGIWCGKFLFLGRTIDFGSVDAIEWRRDLNERNNPLWRMNLSYMGWLVPLLAEGNPEALTLAHHTLASLEAQNPWSEPGVFRDVWHPYSVSHRAINLLAGLALYRQAGGAVAPRDEAMIASHIRLCVAFLLHNLERDLQYNHLLKNMVALHFYNAALETRETRLAFLPRMTVRAIKQQILPDGCHVERAPMYHALCLLDLKILAACGVEVAPYLDGMTHALGTLSHPDGDVSLFNDSWLGEAPRSADLAPPAPDGIADLPDGGYVRLGVGGDAVILDRGAVGPDPNPGHAHADFLSLEASVGGKRFLVDPGVPTYSRGALRDLCRSASQHNGPHLVGKEPIEFWHSFRVGRRGYAYPLNDSRFQHIAPLWAAGWHDGYSQERVTVGRWIGLWPSAGLLVVDRWQGAKLSAGLRFLVEGDWSANGFHFRQGARDVEISALLGTCGKIESAQYWPRFGKSHPAYAVTVTPQERPDGAVAATLWRWGPLSIDMGQTAERIADVLANRLENVL